MEALEAITTRCSIRKFTGEPLTEVQWDKVLRAGFAAPSAHNLRPWHFIGVTDNELLENIADAHPHAKMAPVAGGAILVCGDRNIQEEEGFLVEDCSAAIQNMLIAVNGLGLGAVWCGVYPVEDLIAAMTELFGLPEHVVPIGLVVLGNKAGSRKPFDKYDPSRIHVNGWSGSIPL